MKNEELLYVIGYVVYEVVYWVVDDAVNEASWLKLTTPHTQPFRTS